MTYFDRIKELTKNVPVELVDFSQPRDIARIPTQASSNFITNKEQGDWAENLITRAINDTFDDFIAVKYGKSDDLVAGEDGFDISHIPHDQIDNYVRKAAAGIEVRSISFLIDRYDEAMRVRTEKYSTMAMRMKSIILNEYMDILSHPSRSNI